MNRLRELRKEKGMTMKELGAHFNMSESSVSLYETGKRLLDQHLIELFSKFFDVSSDYLIGLTDERHKNIERISLDEATESEYDPSSAVVEFNVEGTAKDLVAVERMLQRLGIKYSLDGADLPDGVSPTVRLRIDRWVSLRKNKCLSQNDVAGCIGLSQQSYSHYETGVREPDIATIVKLAKFYDVSADYLLGITDKKRAEDSFVLSDHEKELIIAYRDNPTMQAAVDRLLFVPDAPVSVEDDIVEEIKKAGTAFASVTTDTK